MGTSEELPHSVLVPPEQLLPSDATMAIISAALSTSELAPMNAAASHLFETASHALLQLAPVDPSRHSADTAKQAIAAKR